MIAATGLLAVVVASASSVGVANDQVPGGPQTRPILLRGGNLYTVSNGVLPHTDLLFEDGHITRIGRDLDAPPGAEVIDVSGKRVYPGLIAPQTTLGLIEVGAVRATNDRTEVGRVTPEVAAHVAYNPDSELTPTVRAHGITTAQITPLGTLIRGRSFLTHLDGWTKDDSAVALIDGLQVDWPPPVPGEGWWLPETKERTRKEIAERRRQLRQAFDDARAYLLAREADPSIDVDLRWEAMLPALRGEQNVYITADDYREIVEAVEFARDRGLHMVLVGGREAYLASDLLVEHEIPLILGNPTGRPFREDDDYDAAYKQPRLLHEAGVKFCLGRISWGAWDVRNLPLEGGQAVAYGLPADIALRALTLTTAEILGVDDELGSLDVGKQATLFVSEGNVMDLLTQKVTLMFIEGRRVDLDNRNRMLYRKYRQKPPSLDD
jgi:imidazolonepropionase-like amidohydrolase